MASVAAVYDRRPERRGIRAAGEAAKAICPAQAGGRERVNAGMRASKKTSSLFFLRPRTSSPPQALTENHNVVQSFSPAVGRSGLPWVKPHKNSSADSEAAQSAKFICGHPLTPIRRIRPIPPHPKKFIPLLPLLQVVQRLLRFGSSLVLGDWPLELSARWPSARTQNHQTLFSTIFRSRRFKPIQDNSSVFTSFIFYFYALLPSNSLHPGNPEDPGSNRISSIPPYCATGSFLLHYHPQGA
jgi:hypothetical protein